MKSQTNQKFLPKSLTGIQDLDEITRGGLPTGRPRKQMKRKNESRKRLFIYLDLTFLNKLQ